MFTSHELAEVVDEISKLVEGLLRESHSPVEVRKRLMLTEDFTPEVEAENRVECSSTNTSGSVSARLTELQEVWIRENPVPEEERVTVSTYFPDLPVFPLSPS